MVIEITQSIRITSGVKFGEETKFNHENTEKYVLWWIKGGKIECIHRTINYLSSDHSDYEQFVVVNTE